MNRRTLRSSLWLAALSATAARTEALGAGPAEAQDRLADPEPLDWEGDFSERMMDGLHRYVEQKIETAINEQPNRWQPDFISLEAYEADLAPKRERLAKVLGVVDARMPVRMERWGDDDLPALV